MYPHSYTRLHSERPVVLGQGALPRDGSEDAVPGSPEGDEERIALYPDSLPAGFLEGDTQEPLVLGEELAVPFAQAAHQERRALDVGEEKGEGSACAGDYPSVAKRDRSGELTRQPNGSRTRSMKPPSSRGPTSSSPP
jgi:hypothetical protein